MRTSVGRPCTDWCNVTLNPKPKFRNTGDLVMPVSSVYLKVFSKDIQVLDEGTYAQSKKKHQEAASFPSKLAHPSCLVSKVTQPLRLV